MRNVVARNAALHMKGLTSHLARYDLLCCFVLAPRSILHTVLVTLICRLRLEARCNVYMFGGVRGEGGERARSAGERLDAGW
jgi:hypothetical protein